jgi:hypothetical protein
VLYLLVCEDEQCHLWCLLIQWLVPVLFVNFPISDDNVVNVSVKLQGLYILLNSHLACIRDLACIMILQ